MATYRLDPDHAVIAFLVDHVGYADVLGQFTGVEGTIEYDAEARELGAVEITVDPTTVETHQDARDGHIRGSDFLHVEEHPAIVFTANGGTPETETTGTVEGDLEILGQSNALTLNVTLNKVAEYPFGHGKETVGISARGTVLRSEYGMDYALANGLVGDEVRLIIEGEFIRE
jgi:polyisoprenoid-binding protein YceI